MKTLAHKEEVKKLISLFGKKTCCGVQYNNSPCNTCFHSLEADFKHICWLILLGLRGDYDSKEILEDIEKELN
jgi:hypothetical protein